MDSTGLEIFQLIFVIGVIIWMTVIIDRVVLIGRKAKERNKLMESMNETLCTMTKWLQAIHAQKSVAGRTDNQANMG